MENLFCKYYENGQITVEDRNGNSLGFRHIDHTAINKDHLDMLNGVFEQRYTVMAVPEQGRNELCKCLSGKKYKNCCMNLASK